MTDLRIFDPTKVRGIVEDLTRRAESAEQRVAALEADARRYRWLREHFRFANDSMWELWFDPAIETVAGQAEPQELDAAIDAALSPGQPEPKMDGGA